MVCPLIGGVYIVNVTEAVTAATVALCIELAVIAEKNIMLHVVRQLCKQQDSIYWPCNCQILYIEIFVLWNLSCLRLKERRIYKLIIICKYLLIFLYLRTIEALSY